MKPGRANEKEYVYTRGISAARDADFSSAVPFGKAKLGKDSIFWKKGLNSPCSGTISASSMKGARILP